MAGYEEWYVPAGLYREEEGETFVQQPVLPRGIYVASNLQITVLAGSYEQGFFRIRVLNPDLFTQGDLLDWQNFGARPKAFGLTELTIRRYDFSTTLKGDYTPIE